MLICKAQTSNSLY